MSSAAPKPSSFVRYKEAVQFLEGLRNLPEAQGRRGEVKDFSLYLKRTRYLLERLGNPDQRLKVVHITGTSGKGSVSALTQAFLTADGRRTGLFTSPYVQTFSEKMSIDGVYIEADEFSDLLEELKPLLDEVFVSSPFGPPSFFEIFFAMAMLYFSRQNCEGVVLEVGMGGRFDATNVVASPAASAITCIDYDHTEWLGDTLQEIAWNKAGIIKKDSPFFTTETNPELLTYFQKVCTEEGASYEQVEGEGYKERNLNLARRLAQAVGVVEATLEKGATLELPCRFECMQTTPRVYLDGAHNQSKMRSTIFNIQALTYARLFLIVGFADDKDVEAMGKELFPLADVLYCTRIINDKRASYSPLALFKTAESFGKKGGEVHLRLDADQALDEAMSAARPEDLIVVTGSFYLAGKLRAHWYSEEQVLEQRTSFPKK